MENENGYGYPNSNRDNREDTSGINPKELLLKYLQYSWLFALCIVLSLGSSMAVSSIYQTDV